MLLSDNLESTRKETVVAHFRVVLQPGGTEKNYKKHRLGYSVSKPRFESENS